MRGRIEKCRICGSTDLLPVVDLGYMHATGMFPQSPRVSVPGGPLEVVRCVGECGLVQLAHSYDPSTWFRIDRTYGYRSGLNGWMKRHIEDLGTSWCDDLQPGDQVIDIGSNDGTLLNALAGRGLELIGVDPTSEQFSALYSQEIQRIPEFFTARRMEDQSRKKAKRIFAAAMFYDLEDPVQFLRDVAARLDKDGFFICEHSYFPAALRQGIYDSICHEHLEYYGMKQVAFACKKAGLSLCRFDFNEANGGSVRWIAKHDDNPSYTATLDDSIENDLTDEIFRRFERMVKAHKEQLVELVHGSGFIAGFGASTKGNVVLQYCELTGHDIPVIGDANPDKHGAYTPGSLIPIVSEERLLQMKPEKVLVLPWHFKQEFMKKDVPWEWVFPFPLIHSVSAVPA